MRQSREETLEELTPLYLEGRSEEYKQSFYSRDFNRRYQCVMQWKRRHGVSQAAPKQPAPVVKVKSVKVVTEATELSKLLKKVIKMLDGGIEMTAKENEKIGKLLNEIREKLTNQNEIIRQREIERLERQYNDICNRLSQLRNEN